MWDDARFEEFAKLVDFLTSQGAVFDTPTELAKQLHAHLEAK